MLEILRKEFVKLEACLGSITCLVANVEFIKKHERFGSVDDMKIYNIARPFISTGNSVVISESVAKRINMSKRRRAQI